MYRTYTGIILLIILSLAAIATAQDSLSVVSDTTDSTKNSGLTVHEFLKAKYDTSAVKDTVSTIDTASVADDSKGFFHFKGKMVNGIIMHRDPTTAAFLSLFVPGLGQAYTEHWIKATVYFGTDVGFIYGIVVQNSRYKDYLETSKHQKSDRLRKEYERVANFYRDDRNRLIWWTAGLTLLSTFDAFVEGHLYDFVIDPNLGVTPESDGFQAGITIRLQP